MDVKKLVSTIRNKQRELVQVTITESTTSDRNVRQDAARNRSILVSEIDFYQDRLRNQIKLLTGVSANELKGLI